MENTTTVQVSRAIADKSKQCVGDGKFASMLNFWNTAGANLIAKMAEEAKA